MYLMEEINQSEDPMYLMEEINQSEDMMYLMEIKINQSEDRS